MGFDKKLLLKFKNSITGAIAQSPLKKPIVFQHVQIFLD